MPQFIKHHAFDTVLVLGILSAVTGCTNADTKPKPPAKQTTEKFDDGKVSKIAVLNSGDVFLDGRQIPVEDVENEISKLGNSIEGFWYHRESPDAAEPHPNAMKVIEILAARRLPIAFYLDREFTQRMKFKAK